jgi:23S rRNA (guanosine2251-2'-O)-methyltransferase
MSAGAGSGEIVAGRHAVLEALRAGVHLERVLLARGAKPAPILAEIEQLATHAGVPLELADRRRLGTMARGTAHQGVVAVAQPFAYAPIRSLLDAPAPLLVLLDGLTDPGNLGSILRSADAFGFTGVLVPRHRAVGVTPAVRKVAAGAADRVPVALVSSPADTALRVRDAGVPVVGLDPSAPSSYRLLDRGGSVCLVVGAEGKGLSRLVRERCDETVHIPMRGTLASLNAAVAAAVVMAWVAPEGEAGDGG